MQEDLGITLAYGQNDEYTFLFKTSTARYASQRGGGGPTTYSGQKNNNKPLNFFCEVLPPAYV